MERRLITPNNISPTRPAVVDDPITFLMNANIRVMPEYSKTSMLPIINKMDFHIGNRCKIKFFVFDTTCDHNIIILYKF